MSDSHQPAEPQDKKLSSGQNPAAAAAGSSAPTRLPPRKLRTLEQELRTEPFRFDFFQAVYVLEHLEAEREPVGYDALPRDECVRFVGHLSLDFPPSDIADLLPPPEEDCPPRMEVPFLGLYGPSGALPRHYTEWLLERARRKDRTLRDFLDLFNHRLVSLFFRAWEKYRFRFGYVRAERERERAASEDPIRHRAFVMHGRREQDVFSQALLDLAGCGGAHLRYRATVRTGLEKRTAVSDRTIQFFSGLLGQQHRSATSLARALEHLSGEPVRIQEFSGRWLGIDAEFQSQLAIDREVQLGGAAVIGERFWDVQGKYRIRVGPLKYAEFARLLPDGQSHELITDFARLYAGPALDADMQLVLQGAEVPWCSLGGAEGAPARLGWNTWIRNAEFTSDVGDAILRLESLDSGSLVP